MYLLLRFVMLYCKDTGFQYYYKLCRSILSDYHQIRIYLYVESPEMFKVILP